jgi:hypothetical protein
MIVSENKATRVVLPYPAGAEMSVKRLFRPSFIREMRWARSTRLSSTAGRLSLVLMKKFWKRYGSLALMIPVRPSRLVIHYLHDALPQYHHPGNVHPFTNISRPSLCALLFEGGSQLLMIQLAKIFDLFDEMCNPGIWDRRDPGSHRVLLRCAAGEPSRYHALPPIKTLRRLKTLQVGLTRIFREFCLYRNETATLFDKVGIGKHLARSDCGGPWS